MHCHDNMYSIKNKKYFYQNNNYSKIILKNLQNIKHFYSATG